MRQSFAALLFFISFGLYAQNDTLRLSRAEAESLFLANNPDLLIGQLDLEKAEAEVITAGARPNPNLSISEINLWNTGKKNAEELPYLLGNWGNHQQISVALEQTLTLAGKRKKHIAMEKANLGTASFEYEAMLRSLKHAFGNAIIELQFLQAHEKIYENLSSELAEMISGFENQYTKGNISQSELLRLQTVQIQFTREIRRLKREKNEYIRELKILMHLPEQVYLAVSDETFRIEDFIPDFLDDLKLPEQAFQDRPEIKALQSQSDYFSKKLEYENAMRMPDLNVSAAYDRGGGIMQDFVGFGVSMDLPLFDKNKGNIQIARAEILQNQLEEDRLKNEILSEVNEKIQNLKDAVALYMQIDSEYENNLDRLLPAYKKNFMERNLSLLQYIDFIESYVDSKETLLELRKEIQLEYESLLYQSGKEI